MTIRIREEPSISELTPPLCDIPRISCKVSIASLIKYLGFIALRGTATATRKAVHLVSALDHHSHETLAQTLTEQKTNEITAARELLGKLPYMVDSTITFDAMHAQFQTLQPIVSELQADYIVQIKDNQPSVHTYLRKSFGPTPLFSTGDRKRARPPYPMADRCATGGGDSSRRSPRVRVPASRSRGRRPAPQRLERSLDRRRVRRHG